MASRPPHCCDNRFNWTICSPHSVLEGVPLWLIHVAWRRVCGRAQQGEIRGLRRTTAQSERSALLAAARGGSSEAGPGQLQCGRPSSPAPPRVPPPRETTGRASPSLRRPSVGNALAGGRRRRRRRWLAGRAPPRPRRLSWVPTPRCVRRGGAVWVLLCRWGVRGGGWRWTPPACVCSQWGGSCPGGCRGHPD